MNKREVENSYRNCMAAKIRESIHQQDLHLDAGELFAKLCKVHANQIQYTHEHHNEIVCNDGSTLKVIYTDQSYKEGKHPTPTSLSVWDGTLK
ncbi:hypothetical protein [Vibrio sp. D431a]|uniref:hypothetical protein n=1 Tax=Vibrio sp. D431a TaxID=2837388 RepID=UPI0025531B29|nr:hypothetical protein [Vibrio sp. D431a]MDK9793761.1 hypothetical protein [Vibrio sp. D431a]